ncbi:DUF3305 domain-containing protein [Aestuariirhabdus litorea]|uniref:DUF3305 domain-containing protein n=1 Tax=Aestuariirhabdus litorea TaxID=2528527 RepID=A0A3P3VMP6_9GAMM|nr:DUF3305 domain-containing protein [Aestuariirhabdus litorea]RRJ83965.1 DUF3305 domain-containing protein [Aestuariirhabdus litorea]RWW97185.1 DUF3305 domain-containing protein [Endozoicomonadaceae bacterium GTF-13]
MQPQPSPTDEIYPLKVAMIRSERQVGPWLTASWSCELHPADASPVNATTCATLQLQLHRDERAAYRMNLSSRAPKLFVMCDIDELADDDETLLPRFISASQDLAASYMDGGEEDVFSAPMPVAIQCWIEAFMARHGEDESNSGKRRLRGKGGKGKGGDRQEAPSTEAGGQSRFNRDAEGPR